MNLNGWRKWPDKIFNKGKTTAGFSLIELLIALFILMLIVFAFTPLLMGSIERIYYAGDKSEALYRGQADIELDIAERNTVDGYELVFAFGDTEITVPGGLVDEQESEGSATAWLSGFVPFVPSINLHLQPLPLVEGYNPTDIVVMGRDTDFQAAYDQGEYFVIADSGGTPVTGHTNYPVTTVTHSTASAIYEDLPEYYDEYAMFELQEGLTNSGSIYIVGLKWVIENDIEITVRSRLQVVLPYAVAVGEGQGIWISPDASAIWKNRSQIPGTGKISDIIWTGFEFVAVTTSGRVALWRNEGEPVVTESSGTLNSVAYSGANYVVVGDNGVILYSANGGQWSASTAGTANLKAVAYGDKYVAVGSGGTILSSVDGLTWVDESPADAVGVEFRGVAVQDSTWVAVGEELVEGVSKAVIYLSSAGSWSRVESGLDLPALNGITGGTTYDGTSEIAQFIAVGNGGAIIKSSDGTVWEKIILEPAVSDNLYAVDSGIITDGIYNHIAVGDTGTIITWTGIEGESWIEQNSGFTQDLFGVAVRWAE
ncbi:MAG: prepilin-type N-terminal cleavage/methylation domain-containing protein [Bacillota bacterium]|nr:prepilin-type N-terminal cleavage/methylation domain-containing protein [Bacillota bacterium]